MHNMNSESTHRNFDNFEILKVYYFERGQNQSINNKIYTKFIVNAAKIVAITGTALWVRPLQRLN